MTWFDDAYRASWTDTLVDVLGVEMTRDGSSFIAVIDENHAEHIESDGVDYALVHTLRISTPFALEIGDWVQYGSRTYRVVEAEHGALNRYVLEQREVMSEHDPRLHR
jgi:hypothetical protein